MKMAQLRTDEMPGWGEGSARRALAPPPEYEHDKWHDRAQGADGQGCGLDAGAQAAAQNNHAAWWFRSRGSARGITSIRSVIGTPGQPLTVEADSVATAPLACMGLLQGYGLSIKVVDGGSVEIHRLS